MTSIGKNLIWFVSALMVLFMTLAFKPDSESFLGVAQSTDRVLSTSSSGVVAKIFVQAGQAVKKGDPLIELSDVNLQLLINEAKFNLKTKQFERNFAQKLDPTLGKDGATDLTISQLENDLKLKLKQQDSLKIVALQDGYIGDISVAVGEMVQSFQPLATFYSSRCYRIRGYLHETAKVALKPGDKVKVQSAVDIQKEFEAEVLSVGERYTEFPLRLKPAFQANDPVWAREVEIILPEGNTFLPLEKVKIMTGGDRLILDMIYSQALGRARG